MALCVVRIFGTWDQKKILNIQKEQPFTIGRDPKSSYPIDIEKISQEHCTLIYKKDKLYLEIYGKNGLFLNNEHNIKRRSCFFSD